MAYFSSFPVLQYPIRDGSTFRYSFVANILRRVALSDELKGSDGAFLEYSVKDGERPEHIAERVYGDPSFHWLVLLTNDVVDPYHGWFKSSDVLEQYIQKKHGGYSVFVGTAGGQYFYNSNIKTGSTLSQGTYSATIQDYFPQLCKITVSGAAPAEGSASIIVSGGTAYPVNIYRVDQSYTSVHHFENKYVSGASTANQTFMVDPLSQQTNSFSVLGGVIGFTADEFPMPSQGVCFSWSAGIVDFNETYIGKYMGVDGTKVNNYAISNLANETRVNDSKRTIKILHPRFKKEALTQLETLLRV